MFEKINVIKEAVEMRVTGETMVRALSAVSTAAHKKMISEEEYLKKYSDSLKIRKTYWQIVMRATRIIQMTMTMILQEPVLALLSLLLFLLLL